MGEKTTFIEAKQRLTEQAELSRQEDFQRRAEEARLLESATSPPSAVVEAARRLINPDKYIGLAETEAFIQTVCKWVLSQK